jgi:hypothetical protein
MESARANPLGGISSFRTQGRLALGGVDRLGPGGPVMANLTVRQDGG